LFDELDIIVAGIEVLDSEVVADSQHAPLGVEEEAPDPVRAGDSRAAAVWTTWCGDFPPLLCLRDRSERCGRGIRSW
jgi:hypothetical protein